MTRSTGLNLVSFGPVNPNTLGAIRRSLTHFSADHHLSTYTTMGLLHYVLDLSGHAAGCCTKLSWCTLPTCLAHCIHVMSLTFGEDIPSWAQSEGVAVSNHHGLNNRMGPSSALSCDSTKATETVK